MPTVVLGRWILIRLATSPWGVPAAILFLALIPLQQALTPLPGPAHALEQLRTWGALAAILGVLAGLAALTSIPGLLARLDPDTRWRAELGALMAAGAVLLLPTSAGALAAGAAPLEVGLLAPAILTRLLHLGSLGLVLLHPSLPPAPRLALFVAATWLLPALGAGIPALEPLWALLDLQAPFGALTWARLAPALAAALGLFLAARLVRRVRPSDES
ncbi:MAG TPA: hypothetical protein VF530_00700 [Planctomycetota bacterium]